MTEVRVREKTEDRGTGPRSAARLKELTSYSFGERLEVQVVVQHDLVVVERTAVF